MCAFICVLSYMCCHMCAPLVISYMCSHMCSPVCVFSYVCSHDAVSLSHFYPHHCLGSLAGIFFIGPKIPSTPSPWATWAPGQDRVREHRGGPTAAGHGLQSLCHEEHPWAARWSPAANVIMWFLDSFWFFRLWWSWILGWVFSRSDLDRDCREWWQPTRRGLRVLEFFSGLFTHGNVIKS